MKERVDKLLVLLGYVSSRTRAARLIEEGKVFVDSVTGKKVLKPNEKFENETIFFISEKQKYVGRGGEKLEKALEVFGISVEGASALDIGSSTGGFTDCLLQHGTQKVFAVDVGTDQLDASLRINPKVVVLEKTDIRSTEAEVCITEKVDIIVIDVSFISLSHIFPHLKKFTKEHTNIIALIKPQFEVGKENIKEGVVTDPILHQKAVTDVTQYAHQNGFSLVQVIDSPILGGSGNKEFLGWFK